MKVEPEIDDSDDQVPVSSISRRRQGVESRSPASPVDTSPPLSSTPSSHPEKPPYYTVVSIRYRPPGSGTRFAPNQRQIAKTPAAIYGRSQVPQPVAGPSNPATRVGPPKHRLPDRTGPKLRPATELVPPRPPPPLPGLAALEARINAFVVENQKLRDELATAKNDLVTARNELTSALARVNNVEQDLHGLEALEMKLEELKGDNERLSTLLSSEHLFDSERFRTTIHAEVKSSFGYYWPSAKTDMKNQLWKEVPPKVKEFVEKEIGRVVDQVTLVRSEVVTLQQKYIAGGNVQNGDPAMGELGQATEQVQEESEATISEVGRAQEFEKNQDSSPLAVPRLTLKDTGDSA